MERETKQPGRHGSGRLWAIRLCAVLVFGFLSMVFVVRFFGCAERLAYWPTRGAFQTPAGYEDVSFASADGTMLHAWFMPAQGLGEGEHGPAVLHCHGNAGNISFHDSFSDYLPAHGISVLLFDYRSFGRSDKGTLRRDLLLEDSRAALDALLARPDVDPAHVGVLGVSLGGAFALALDAEREEVRAVCTVGAFSTWRGVAKDWVPLLGPLLLPGGLDPVDSARALGDTPWLIVHGTRDEVINRRHAGLLRDAARGATTTLRWVEGGDHNYLLEHEPAVKDEIARFFLDSMPR